MTNEQMRVELPELKATDHPDVIGGIVWSPLERRAIQAYATAAILADRERRAAKDAGDGEVVVTWDEGRTRIVAVTRQDSEGRVIEVVEEAPPAPAAPVNVAASKEFDEWWDQSGQFIRAGGGDYEKTFAFNAWNAALAATQQAEPSAKYLVCTGVVHEGEETYTVHDKPVPLADNWKLYTAPLASKEATPSAAEPELIAAARAVVARWHTPKWKDEAPTAEFIQRLERALAGVDSQTPASTGVVPQKPVEVDDNPWLPHNGGPCPVDLNALVEVKFRDGAMMKAESFPLRWDHRNSFGDIIEYRLHREGGE